MQQSPVSRRSVIGGAFSLGVSAMVASPAACTTGGLVDAAWFRRPFTNDREVLRQALAAWQKNGTGTLRLEAGRRYDVGWVDSGPDLFPVSGIRNGVLEGNGATIVARSASGLVWNLLSFSSVETMTIARLAAYDQGYRDDAWGMKMVVLQPGGSGTTGVLLEGVRGTSLLSMVQTQGPPGPRRVSGIQFNGDCIATRCYYALCCQDQGDDISGALSAIDCRRAYIAYGVSRHAMDLAIHHEDPIYAPGSHSAVLIKSYGRETRDLTVNARFSGTLAWHGLSPEDHGSCATLEHQPQGALPTAIRRIKLRLEIDPAAEDPFGARLLSLSSFDRRGQLERHTSNLWEEIELDLRTDRPGTVAMLAEPKTPVDMIIRGDVGMVRLEGIANALRVIRARG